MRGVFYAGSSLWFTYSSFLVHISSIGQKVHHALKMAFPGSPDQWSGAVLGEGGGQM